MHDGAGVIGLANMLGDDHCFLCFAATWQNTSWITRGRPESFASGCDQKCYPPAPEDCAATSDVDPLLHVVVAHFSSTYL